VTSEKLLRLIDRAADEYRKDLDMVKKGVNSVVKLAGNLPEMICQYCVEESTRNFYVPGL
jgi:hypothetical protein